MIPGIVAAQFGGGGGPVVPLLWDDTDDIKFHNAVRTTRFAQNNVTNVTLSNGDATVTHSSTATNSGVFFFDSKISCKYYFEVVMTTINGDFDSCGIFSGFTMSDLVTTNINCTKIQKLSGNIYTNNVGGTPAASLGGLASGDVINIAIDLGARRAWFRKNGTGNWNGSGTADPVTNTGGLTISSGTFTPAVGFGGTGSAANDSMTAKFAGFSFPPPTGFTYWSSTSSGSGPVKFDDATAVN